MAAVFSLIHFELYIKCIFRWCVLGATTVRHTTNVSHKSTSLNGTFLNATCHITVQSQNRTCHQTYLSQKKTVTKHIVLKSVQQKILFCLSRSVFPLLPVPFCLSCSAWSILSFLFCLFCSVFPVPPVPFNLSGSACPVLPAPFCPSFSACPVLPVQL
jgi:hypothetical protein